MTSIEAYYAHLNDPWIGVDLDGTLARYDGQTHDIGEPIPRMVERIQGWLAEGIKVKIVTARLGYTTGRNGFGATDSYREEQRKLIAWWTKKHIGVELEATASKDFKMIELWDDRAIQVIENTGERADGKP